MKAVLTTILESSWSHFAERGGFEPPKRFWRLHAFQACLFNHSSTSPILVDQWGIARRLNPRANGRFPKCDAKIHLFIHIHKTKSSFLFLPPTLFYPSSGENGIHIFSNLPPPHSSCCPTILAKEGKISKGEQEKRKIWATDNLRKVSHVASVIPKDEQKTKSPQVFTWGDGEGNCTEAFKRKEGSRVSICIPERSLSSNKGNLT